MPLRAHEVGNYCSKNFPSVAQSNANGTYLFNQVRDVDNQGHVYIKHNGTYYGNGNYDWINNNPKGGKISTRIYKIKWWYENISPIRENIKTLLIQLNNSIIYYFDFNI